MFNIFKKFPKHRRIFKAVIFVMIVAVFFIDAKNVIAADTILGGIGYFATGSVGGAVAIVLGLIALVLTAVIGGLITVVVAVLVQVAQFGNIINVPTVIEGWVIIRDLCNMLFILILLIIAFATILRVESYSWKKVLPKLLIMAILINFSRTIFGLLIDFSQVIMLTFVNSFSQYGAANFISVFNTNFLLSIQGGWTSKEYAITSWSTSVAIIAGVLAAIITLIVISVMLAVLVVRIVMLWIYTIFSPLIFLGFAFPPLQKYTGKIWDDFTKQLVVGPVLAFFIWLALTTAKTSTVDLLAGKASTEGVEICAGIGAFFCQGNFQQFIIVIGLLMGGLMVTQQVGGAIGSAAGKGLAWAKRAPLALGAGGLFMGGWGARKIKSGAISELLATKQITKDAEGNEVVKWKGRVPGLGGLAGALYGLELRPTKMIQGIKEGLKATAEREEGSATEASAISLKRGGIGGLIKGLGVSRDLTENLIGPRGFRGVKRVFKATIGGGQEKINAVEEEIKKQKADIGTNQAKYNQKEEENNKKTIEIKRNIKTAYKAGNITEAKRLEQNLVKQKLELNSIGSAMQKQMEKIDRLEKDLRLRKPIQTFYADRARDEAISRAGKTLGNNDNEEFLVDAFQDALVNGNKEVAQAVMIHAAKVGHLNEIIQGYKSRVDIYDKNKKLVVKAGDALPQGGYGLNQLVKQALIEDLGIDEQTAYAAQSEASSLAKGVRHQNLSETVGTKNGLLYQRAVEGPGGQQARARSEARKIDSERFVRDYNRLAWGDEFQTASGREFRLNALGLDNFTETADIISKEITGRRFNKNAAMNIANDSETLRAWARKLEEKKIKYYDGSANGGKGGYESYVDLAERLIKFGEGAAQAQKRDTIGNDVKELQRQILEQQKRPI